jgi:Nucleotidyltransferase domain
MQMNPEDKANEFVKRAREASGTNLESVILFGSAISGNFRPGLSDLNLFCVLRDSSFVSLQALAPVVKWWDHQKQPPPLCMTHQELQRSADVFAIELLDMAQHHRVLFGEDVLQGLQISTHLHRVQVEYELREKLILLRQHLLLANGNPSHLWDVVLHSAPSFTTLFRHALVVLGGGSLTNRREAVEGLSKQVDFDPAAFQQALDVREGKTDRKQLHIKDLCARYLAAIEKTATAVDRALDPEASAHH